jgi:hypothetical protein
MSDDLQTGWFSSLDIPTVLRQGVIVADDARYVLISMVDSTPHVASLPSLRALLERMAVFRQIVDDDLVIETSTLLTLVEVHDFFTGFDEIWLCTEIPGSSKPGGVRITSDAPLATVPYGDLAPWMLASGCRIGLGDGDGLNMVATDPRLAQAIAAASKGIA